ncbi:FliA/WhiG family RNA polymerase sigma factor [Calidifontibacillus erzurumensis]|uniref:FliA/WhiG family RNA polymerase sigma factor n=1 Tax=Calidifontibacillus erzurumensis TaxID=2741433 RepID=A0A8J8KAS3_9BACI|nr:FliA/WhiG family RNA polymerase sigma factor [Calidifontibacillus erzurumensis]NSL51159.1 FliA/WhiG family RNA polymerase sigma factor [Calidifontibacillus erzurumensis]
MTQLPTNEDLIWQRWIETKDPQAGDSLIRLYMPLVNYHVQRILVGLPKNVSKEDVKSYALLGLYDAIEKFDLSRELKFDTYASFRIRGAIIDGLRKEDWLPRSLREKHKKIEAAIERLEQKLMRNATIEEIAKEVKMSTEEVEHAITESFFANILSLDEGNKDAEEQDGINISIRDENMLTPEEQTIKEELYHELAQTISELSDKEQLVLSLFYKEELTLTEIGQVLGLSTSRISQIHSKALLKLRRSLGKLTAI